MPRTHEQKEAAAAAQEAKDAAAGAKHAREGIELIHQAAATTAAALVAEQGEAADNSACRRATGTVLTGGSIRQAALALMLWQSHLVLDEADKACDSGGPFRIWLGKGAPASLRESLALLSAPLEELPEMQLAPSLLARLSNSSLASRWESSATMYDKWALLGAHSRYDELLVLDADTLLRSPLGAASPLRRAAAACASDICVTGDVPAGSINPLSTRLARNGYAIFNCGVLLMRPSARAAATFADYLERYHGPLDYPEQRFLSFFAACAPAAAATATATATVGRLPVEFNTCSGQCPPPPADQFGRLVAHLCGDKPTLPGLGDIESLLLDVKTSGFVGSDTLEARSCRSMARERAARPPPAPGAPPDAAEIRWRTLGCDEGAWWQLQQCNEQQCGGEQQNLAAAQAQKALRRAYELYHRPFLSKADVLGEQFATLARHTNRTYCSVAKQAAKQAGAHELTSRCAAADTREAALNAFAEATRREGALFDRQLASPSAARMRSRVAGMHSVLRGKLDKSV